MLRTLTGENSYGWQQELRALVATFIREHGDLALERLDGEEAEYARIQEALTSLPFLASRKLVVLRAPSKNKQFIELAAQLFDNIPETSDVILVEPKLDKRLSYYKLLKKVTDFHEYRELDNNALASWLVAAAKDKSGTLTISDARYLIDRVGLDQQLVGNELEKLLLYNARVSKQTIDLLTEQTPQSTIFELIEAAFAGNAQKALQLYSEQRALKVEAPQIIALLAWQLHVLAVMKTAGERTIDEIAKQAKMSPFVLRKSQSIARDLRLATLKNLISTLLAIDVQSKRTNLDIDEALQQYFITMSNS